MSTFAFGTYRISDSNPQHIQALKEAIRYGIKIIDTSSNYMDGGAERAVAIALAEFDHDVQEEIEIISKYGYIQGALLREYLQDSSIIENSYEMVKYSQECYHSISSSFMREQLTLSLKRLKRDSIECYLIHNPEYYLLDAINRSVGKDERLDGMYARLQEAFVGLEKEIESGRINSYGISSNSFALPESSEEFLPYEDLLTLAQNAAMLVGNKKHSFTTIELPVNILERDGLKCAAWAKKNGLRVLANRPLNAKYNNKMYRLADYEESREYYHHFNELLELCDNEELKTLYNLVEQLDATMYKFDWIGDYDIFLYTQIVPLIRKTLENIDINESEELIGFLDTYLIEYKKMVAYECSKRTRTELEDFFKECFVSMQECAMRFLMQTKNVDVILVGMRKPSYVHQILAVGE
ncbi:MAG: aldo/keto reductase [Sulfurimonas sp.]|uniref:aldo/keto reductase n=1 Tax=Sulfurimonas sp. TaxID=2022749 RepID=UPI002608FAA9|nr:aldo/keto reductase [Sulfurimonas sp.]MDD2652086.1 aldo/keto reductase [Sulfurimonas sp.]MDD3452004.1 aldo/keto reductase [Sulfurimonas sp.]